jgi:pimeloyl-ACP methyl ester carboxylesterase
VNQRRLSFLLVAALGALATSVRSAPPGAVGAAPPPDAVVSVGHVEQRGTGPVPMVLVPGISCDWRVFETFMDRNAARYTMYAVTLPGFGGSPPPPPPGDDATAWLDHAEAAIWRVVTEHGLNDPVIVGHGLGGHLALRIGIAHRDEVAAIVSIDGGPLVPYGSAAMGDTDRRAMAKRTLDAYAELDDETWVQVQFNFGKRMATDAMRGVELGGMYARAPRAAVFGYMSAFSAADLRDRLPSLTVPTLVVAALQRDPQRPQMAREMVLTWQTHLAAAPEHELVVMDGSRHFVQDDRPDELDELITRFLAASGVPPGS